jgi:long-chain acyl-CoA synthetase
MEEHPASGPALTPDPVGLHTRFERTADRLPDAIALRFGDEQWSFRELDRLANAAAGCLAERGVGRGQRVALVASGRAEFPIFVQGILKAGASVVMVSPAWKRGEVAHAFDLTGPSLVVCDGSTSDTLAGVIGEDRVLHLDREGGAAEIRGGSDERPGVEADWAATEAVLVFSSGTTGLPKAVRHTHASLEVATAHWISALGLGTTDRLQVATPPFHILGLLNLFAAGTAGAGVRLHARFDIDDLLRSIEIDRITLEMAVAPIALAMADHPELERYDFSSLRYIMWGATPVTESVARRVSKRTGVRFLPAYGASEVPVITANPVRRPDAWRLDSAGLPLDGVELRIVDLETGGGLEPGGVGEIQVRSASAMVGYLPEEANADAFVDGWYRTGDVGWVEPEGWLHITDRVKEMIKVKGFQVAPAEVEAVLQGHPDVVDCAVFGVPDPATGEAVIGAVTLREGAAATPAELAALVTERLAAYKRLGAVHVVEEIPRLPSGKVLRRVLRDRFADAPSAGPSTAEDTGSGRGGERPCRSETTSSSS